VANEESNRTMNNTSNPTPSQPQGGTQPEGATNSQASLHGRCVFEPLSTAVNEGAHRARAAAEKAIPKVKTAVLDATYWLGYGVSFAAVFSYTIVKELTPEVLKTGCRDGAATGQKLAEELASKFKAQPDDHCVVPPPGTDPSGPAAQPDVA
jgi:hypothetical protein